MKQLITLMLLISTFILNAQSTEKRICTNVLTEISSGNTDTIYSEDKNCNLYLLTEESNAVEMLLIENGKVTFDERYYPLCNIQDAILYKMGTEYMFLYDDKIVIQSKNKIVTYNCKVEDRTPEPEYEFLLDSVTITNKLNKPTPITLLSDTTLTRSKIGFLDKIDSHKETPNYSIDVNGKTSMYIHYGKTTRDTFQSIALVMDWSGIEIKPLYSIESYNESLFGMPKTEWFNLDFTPFVVDPKKHYIFSSLSKPINEK
jgi:hypothetical protein